jgi:alanine dehydrogenase
MSNATWPFISQIAELGIDNCLKETPALNNGVYTYQGKIINKVLSNALEGRKKS